MYKAFILTCISLLCVFAGCTDNEMPTDKAMITHFTENELAFVKLQHLISESLTGEHYPAFDHDPDSSRLLTISAFQVEGYKRSKRKCKDCRAISGDDTSLIKLTV